jgi:hypothetical protein
MSEQTTVPIVLRMDDLAVATRMSVRSINRLRSAGRIPAPDFIYGRRPRWFARTIEKWLSEGGLIEPATSRATPDSASNQTMPANQKQG